MNPESSLILSEIGDFLFLKESAEFPLLFVFEELLLLVLALLF